MSTHKRLFIGLFVTLLLGTFAYGDSPSVADVQTHMRREVAAYWNSKGKGETKYVDHRVNLLYEAEPEKGGRERRFWVFTQADHILTRSDGLGIRKAAFAKLTCRFIAETGKYTPLATDSYVSRQEDYLSLLKKHCKKRQLWSNRRDVLVWTDCIEGDTPRMRFQAFVVEARWFILPATVKKDTLRRIRARVQWDSTRRSRLPHEHTDGVFQLWNAKLGIWVKLCDMKPKQRSWGAVGEVGGHPDYVIDGKLMLSVRSDHLKLTQLRWHMRVRHEHRFWEEEKKW